MVLVFGLQSCQYDFYQDKEMEMARKTVVERALQLVQDQAAQSTDYITTSAATKKFAVLKMAGKDREVFGVFFLNSRHALIEYREMFHGTLASCTVHTREIMRAALLTNAGAIILTHNHPSGDPEPSKADISLTRDVMAAGMLLEIRVLDHIVVGGGKVVSMAERGLMEVKI